MMKKKKTGKELEKLVRLIQESLKDSPHTIIHSNYKIPNTSGRKREIDILIESRINDFNIKIAIECKDYARAVSVDKIEGFNSMCDRIPEINKKIFVSTNGYQADAINAARDYKIELYQLQNINHKTINGWIPEIRQVKLRYLLKGINLHLDDDNVDENLKLKDALFYFYDGRQPQSIYEVIDKIISNKSKEIWSYTIYMFVDRSCVEPQRIVNLPFQISLNGVFIVDETSKEKRVIGVESSVDAWLEEDNIVVEEVNSLVNFNNREVKANNISIPIGEEKSNLIFTNNKYSIFHTDKNGLTQELKNVFTHYPSE